MTVPVAFGMRVLLVEDHPGNVVMVREVSDELLPGRLDVVGDGAAALAFMRRTALDDAGALRILPVATNLRRIWPPSVDRDATHGGISSS